MFKVKKSKWFVSGLMLTTTLGLGGFAFGDEVSPQSQLNGVLSKTELTQDNYCHLKFPAIRPSTLGTDRPQLKSPGTGDIVDYYGPCSHDPLGRDEVASQRQSDELIRDRDYHR